MSRSLRVLLLAGAMLAVAALASACGSEKIKVAKSSPVYGGAVLFSQRCSGCHTLSYAGTNGSAPNVRTAQSNSGPNFNVRCERPVTRVLYAIQNGGFSGAYMPQNVVVGQDAMNVAKFVATYAGRQEPTIPGTPKCQTKPIGTIPAPVTPTATAAASASSTTTSTSSSTTTSTAASASSHKKSKQKKSAHS
ncbi:MAG TPA: c-type cytochrome [Solirubrobacteraceae bacterium]